jgi:hypothetical protein
LLPVDALRRFEGYYQDASPRQALQRALDVPLGGRTVRVDGDHLTLAPVLGPSERLVPVNDAIFRREHESAPSMAFTTVDGNQVLAGLDLYAEKRSRWPYDLLRFGLGTALALALVAPVAALLRGAAGRGRGWTPARGLGLGWTAAGLAFAGTFALTRAATLADLAAPSLLSWGIYACSLLHPMLAFALLPLTALAWTSGVGPVFASFAAAAAAAHVGLAAYMGWWGLIAFRSWAY